MLPDVGTPAPGATPPGSFHRGRHTPATVPAYLTRPPAKSLVVEAFLPQEIHAPVFGHRERRMVAVFHSPPLPAHTPSLSQC